MRSVSFDTLEYLDVLKKAGMKEAEAEAITKATSQALNQMIEYNKIVTKDDIINLKIDLQSFIIKSISTSIMILGGWQALLSYFH